MFADLALLIPLLPALGWLLITLFSRAMHPRASAWLATLLMAGSTVLAIGLFAEVNSARPRWDLQAMEKQYIERYAAGADYGKEAVAGAPEQSTKAEAASELLERPAIGQFPIVREWPWLELQGQQGLPFGLYLDQLAAIMTLMVAFVATLIHLFSIGYMASEDRYPTFFAYINLFAAAMLAMVMSKNLFHVLLFWEIMGLMSYLLIGFFYKKRSAQQAQKKAFLTVRIGDLAFMAGLFWLYQRLGTLDIPTILARGEAGTLLAALGAGAATGIGLLLFLAAVGKSAQFPLHVWLPDAMEGPTPVSAMIHAATMVAAGVYLVARAYPIMEVGNALTVVGWIGGITALLAATMAPAMADAKKIMAFSTLSQLGYMFLSLGVFGYTAAIFHLLTHAFFKALLFLGSGSMIHGSGTQDIFEMDRLSRYQKWTTVTVWVGALSLMGVPLFAGFWSKDEILHAAQGENTPLYLIGLATAVLTAFYTTRMMIIAFYKPATPSPWFAAPWNQQGEPSLNMSAAEVRSDLALTAAHGHGSHGSAHDDGHASAGPGEANATAGVPHDVVESEHTVSKARQPHESGPEMIVPLVLLAIGATVMGLLGSPLLGYWFQRFVYFREPEVTPLSFALVGFATSAALVILGAGASFLLYRGDHLRQRAPLALTQLLQRRYYIDDLYYAVVARVAQLPTYFLAWLDRNLIDRLVDLTGGAVSTGGDFLRRVQTGSLQFYAWLTIIGAGIIAFAFTFAQAGGAR